MSAIDPMSLGRELGNLTTTLQSSIEAQAEWRDSVKAMMSGLRAEMSDFKVEMREFKAEIREDMDLLKENTETGLKSLQSAVSEFRMKYVVGKTALASFSIAAGAILVLVALGYQEGLQWMARKVMTFLGLNG